MHTHPVIALTSSPRSLSTSPSLKPLSSLTRLPSLQSSTSFSSPSYTSIPNQSSTLGLASGSWSRPDLVNRRNSDSKRSVRWLDSSARGYGGKDSRRSSSSSKKSATDPAKIWARYRQTVRPDFRLEEPSRSRLSTKRGKSSSRSLKPDVEDDSKYVMKMSLPCPSHCCCCFCVYSRQLGPVRIYFSNFNRPKLHPMRKISRNGNGAAKSADTTLEQNEDVDNGLVFLKDPWMTSSAPSGEVIVPDVATEPEQCLHHHLRVSKLKFGEVIVGEGKDEYLLPKKKSFHGRTASKQGVRNSAPPEFCKNTFSKKNPPKNLQLPRSLTYFTGDFIRIPKSRREEEYSFRAPRNSPKLHRTNTEYMDGKGKETHSVNMPGFDSTVKGPHGFPSRFLTSPKKSNKR